MEGRFAAWFVDEAGFEQWRDEFANGITTTGKNLALDSYLGSSGGSAPGGSGPFIGLIDATSFTGLSVADTMSSHGGWLEATYYTARLAPLWSAAASGSKSVSVAIAFAITGGGTVKGLFLVFGSGASATIGNTGGTLYSTGVFNIGDQIVTAGTLFCTYEASL